MADPPSDAGAVQVTETCVLSRVGVTPVGGPGTVAGVAAADAADAGPVPTVFVAVTVKVYAAPFVRSVTVHDNDAVVHVKPPGLDVTV
jgi:hypothetical protein